MLIGERFAKLGSIGVVLSIPKLSGGANSEVVPIDFNTKEKFSSDHHHSYLVVTQQEERRSPNDEHPGGVERYSLRYLNTQP